MKTKRFITVVKGDHKLGNNPFILGRISAFKDVLCGELDLDGKGFAITRNDNNDAIIVTECTQAEYDRFTTVVNALYTGLCIFDVVNECAKEVEEA